MRSWISWDAGASGFGSAHGAKSGRERGAKKVAMLMQNDAFGRHVACDIYAPLFAQAGIAFDEEWFEPGTNDFSSVLAKIAAEQTRLFCFPATPMPCSTTSSARPRKSASPTFGWKARLARPGPEEQGRDQRIRHLHPEIFRGSREDPTEGQDLHRRSTRPTTIRSSPTSRRRFVRRPATTTSSCWSRR